MEIKGKLISYTPYLAVLLLLQNILIINGLPSNKGCRCVPDRWAGILNSVERQYDLRGGQTASSENVMFVNYDYVNHVFAIEEPATGNMAISDYKEVSILDD